MKLGQPFESETPPIWAGGDDVALEIELDGEIDYQWVYNVGQAYADANVVAGEITDVLREVGDEP